MRKITQAFTLVELLVVITILAIISVVAYQNFG
jgi:prepilin-type N-terminal cleavage/methylation domain-containing protein